MKRLLILGVTVLALAGSIYLAARDQQASVLKIDQAEIVNPWSSLSMNNDPRNFQFAIVTDRTGKHRSKVFEKAVRKLNLMHPEFVITVGDLIEGDTFEAAELEDQWTEFEGFINELKAPFFYVPGNHDLRNPVLVEMWNRKFGRRYYHFQYHDTLFLVLNTEEVSRFEKDPPIRDLGGEQVAYFEKILRENQNVRHTLVFLHKPLWTYDDGKGSGWDLMEKALAGRKYTVFCGHMHNYETWIRNGNRYIQLATTGGGSLMRGKEHGEFDQIAWVTMTQEGPDIANVLLEGIVDVDLKEDMKLDEEMLKAQELQKLDSEKRRLRIEKYKADEEARRKALNQ